MSWWEAVGCDTRRTILVPSADGQAVIKGAFHTVSSFQTPDTLINFKLQDISEHDEVAFFFFFSAST